MKITTTCLVASAMALMVSAANAASVQFNNDTLIGAAKLKGANEDVEVAALADILKVDVGTLEKGFKYEGGDFTVNYSAEYDQFSVDITPDTPGYFILKLGNIKNEVDVEDDDPIYTHFFFENLEDLSILAWGGSFCYGDLANMGMYDAAVRVNECDKTNWVDVLGRDGGKLSHITTTSGDGDTTTVVPLPAAGWLLLGGLGGLAALRRRNKV